MSYFYVSSYCNIRVFYVWSIAVLFGFKLACLLPMGHESHGSWVKTLMGHMGLGQTILTHCQL